MQRSIATCVLAVVMGMGLLPLPGGAKGQDAGHDDVESLRLRVIELEAQNAQILEQLNAIRSMLDEAGTSPAPGNVQLATTGPAPAASVARAIETARPALLDPARLAPARLEPVQGGPATVEAEGNGSEIGFYGFVRVDAIFDDSRANNFQAPTLIRSEPVNGDSQSNFTIHPRLTRFGMNFRAPDNIGSIGAELTGRIEADFQNGGRESRAVPRMRHAYMQVAWDGHSILAGQTSDLISPLFPAANADTLMWNAGNLGDRRMQVRYGYSAESGLSLEAGIGLTGAVDPLDADGNDIRDGEAATMPNFQGRVAYTGPNYTVGAWSHYARMHTDATFGGQDDFEGYSYGLDFDFNLTPQLALRGEAWAGSNLGDLRGGIGQSFNLATGREIDSRGGWVELGFQNGLHGIFTGFTTDDPKNWHVGPGGATENRAWFLTNRFNLADPLTLGVDYIHWRTKYRTDPEGTDNRINVYLIYGF